MVMNLIVLTGMPASGKSTVASRISGTLGLPVLAKDALKEALFDTIGFRNYAEKRKLDHAANAVLLRCAEALLKSGQSMILDNNFDQASSETLDLLVQRYDCKCIIIFFGGNTDVFYDRYVERDKAHQRHPGHVVQDHYPLLPGESADYVMTRHEFSEKFEKRGMNDFHCRGSRIDLDATEPEKLDMGALIEQIRSLMEN